MPSSPPIIVETNPHSPPSATVIWLHGLGADGHDFEPIVSQLGLPKDLSVRFIFPHAPQRSVSINFGAVMRAWFDISQTLAANSDHLAQSEKLIDQLIQKEIDHGIPASNIILAGFSQGGALALYTGLRYPKPLAGIMSLSGFFPKENACINNQFSTNTNTPIFLAHGHFDPIVPFHLGKHVLERLKSKNHPVDWHEYPMEHQVCPEEILAVGKWMERVLIDDSVEEEN
jgi:phospholipase/carboxylesterase